MRRPLKPFVTEYKGSARRQKDPIPAGPNSEPSGDTAWGMRAAPDRAPSVKAPKPVKAEANGDYDSYEAALRAADALFTRAPAKLQPEERRRSVISDEQPYDPRDASDRSELPGAPTGVEAITPDTPERFGRILRAIDEPAADPFAQMEAERAPKKRGRKPGSKNKPKPAVTVVPALEATAELSFEEDELLEGIAPTPIEEPRPRSVTQRAYPVSSADKSQRYAWVRKRLGPGEQWKRRLPKVIW